MYRSRVLHRVLLSYVSPILSVLSWVRQTQPSRPPPPPPFGHGGVDVMHPASFEIEGSRLPPTQIADRRGGMSHPLDCPLIHGIVGTPYLENKYRLRSYPFRGTKADYTPKCITNTQLCTLCRGVPLFIRSRRDGRHPRCFYDSNITSGECLSFGYPGCPINPRQTRLEVETQGLLLAADGVLVKRSRAVQNLAYLHVPTYVGFLAMLMPMVNGYGMHFHKCPLLQ